MMDSSSGERGDTVLRENHTWGPHEAGAGTTDKIPEKWVISEERLKEMFDLYG